MPKRPDQAPVAEIGHAGPSSGSGAWWLSQLEETPELQWPSSTQVYSRMRRQDAQITSVLRAVTLPVRRTPWRIDPQRARDEVVELVAQDLGLPVVGRGAVSEAPTRTRGRFSWSEHLQWALLCVQYGHMFFEQVYTFDEKQRARLRKLAPRMPHTLSKISVARDGGLESIEQLGVANPIPVSRLVAYVHEREGGDWTGTSLLRPAYKHWLIKDKLLRVQATTIERNGMGVPVYEAGPSDQQEQLDKGKAIATSYKAGSASGAAIPHGAKLNLLGVSGNIPPADPAIKYHDEQIGRAVLAHFLNLGSQTGSWALGSTFADFFVMSLQTLAQTVADVATQHIVEDLVDLNFGTKEPAPRIVFDEIGSRQSAVADALKILVEAGLLVPDLSLERAVRQSYGLPEKDASTEVAPAAPEQDAQ